MKIFLFFILSIFSFLSFAQEFQVMDSLEVQELDIEAIEYANISIEKDIVIEAEEDILVDFNSIDFTDRSIDSVLIVFTKGDSKKSYKINKLSPFLIKGVNSSFLISASMYRSGNLLQFKSTGNDKLTLKIDYRNRPTFVSDTIVFGILAIVLALIFYTSSIDSKRWKKFYMFIPALLLCYLIPAILDSLGLISKEYSTLYPMAKNYLLPGALIS